MRLLIPLVLMVITCGSALAQPKPNSVQDEHLWTLAGSDIKAFAQDVSKNATSEVGRAQAIVRWLTQHFEWKATDYQKRTVQQIVERRGGNCNDLAMVALAAMKELNITLRRVHEVHIRTESAGRGESAHAMVKERGNAYSVFGRHHNDHIYLEVYDSSADDWFPADPWSGVVGVDEWMKARVWFGPRSSPNPDAPEMIVPIAIFAADLDGNFTINRTQHYLVDEFDRLYRSKLHQLPAWKQWTALLDVLDDKVKGAFAGTINLQDYESQIDTLAEIYEKLRAESQSSAAGKLYFFFKETYPIR